MQSYLTTCFIEIPKNIELEDRARYLNRQLNRLARGERYDGQKVSYPNVLKWADPAITALDANTFMVCYESNEIDRVAERLQPGEAKEADPQVEKGKKGSNLA